MPGIIGNTPGEDSCCRGGLVYLERPFPGRAMISGEAIVYVVVVAENGIDVASLVKAHVREIVIVADLLVGPVIHDVIGEGLAAIGGNCHPDRMIGAGTRFPASHLTGIVDTIESLIDDVATWVNHQVADLVVVDEKGMTGINGIAQLCECRSSIGAAIHIDIERRDIVIRDTDFRSAIGRDPFTVVARYCCARWIERPGFAVIGARADIDIGQSETGDVDIVVTNGVFHGRRCQVSVAATRREPGVISLGACVGRHERDIMTTAVSLICKHVKD